jgi:type IV secretory pathway VirB4 component
MTTHLKHWNQRAKGFMGLVREAIGMENTRFDRDAVTMIDMTEDAIVSNSSGLVRYGFMTKVVVLMNKDKVLLEEAARTIRRQLQQLGYLIRHESVNAVDAYLGSIPGHGYYNLRKPLMDSLTLANTAPISSIYQGAVCCPCSFYSPESPALFYSKTAGSTPYRFNLHIGGWPHDDYWADRYR